MFNGLTYTNDYLISFHICTDDKRGLLWIEVVTYENGKPRQTKDFSGNDYGAALDYYQRRQAELKEQYGE